MIGTWPRVIPPFVPSSFLFRTRSRSRGGGNARRWWPRSSRTPGSPYSACTRFDYRSRFEDRLIASSVDEEAEKEVVGSPASCQPPLQQPRVVSRQDPWDGSPAWPRRMRLDTTENRAVTVGEKLCVFRALFRNANKFSLTAVASSKDTVAAEFRISHLRWILTFAETGRSVSSFVTVLFDSDWSDNGKFKLRRKDIITVYQRKFSPCSSTKLDYNHSAWRSR